MCETKLQKYNKPNNSTISILTPLKSKLLYIITNTLQKMFSYLFCFFFIKNYFRTRGIRPSSSFISKIYKHIHKLHWSVQAYSTVWHCADLYLVFLNKWIPVVPSVTLVFAGTILKSNLFFIFKYRFNISLKNC